MKSVKKALTAIISAGIIISVFAVNACADSLVTNRVDAKHDGSSGVAYSPYVAVNTTVYNGTKLAWTADVINSPSKTTYNSAAVSWKLFRNTESFSNLGSASNVTVGNTTNSGTVSRMIGYGTKNYTHFNNKYKFYVNVTACPPAYKYTTTFKVGGVFYGT